MARHINIIRFRQAILCSTRLIILLMLNLFCYFRLCQA